MKKTANILYCEYCNWKKITKDFSDIKLKEVFQEKQSKSYKCPSCGRLIKSKKINDPQKELENDIAKEKQNEELKKWAQETLNYREEFENE